MKQKLDTAPKGDMVKLQDYQSRKPLLEFGIHAVKNGAFRAVDLEGNTLPPDFKGNNVRHLYFTRKGAPNKKGLVALVAEPSGEAWSIRHMKVSQMRNRYQITDPELNNRSGTRVSTDAGRSGAFLLTPDDIKASLQDLL